MYRFYSALMLLALMSAASAAGIGQQEARRLREAGAIVPLAHIIAAALALEPGRVLDSELERDDGHYVYEIELLNAVGVVHELEFDAATGELLDRETED